MIHIPSFLDSFNALADVAGCSDMIQTEGGFQFKKTETVQRRFLTLFHLM